MTPKHSHASDPSWTCSLLVGLLIILTAWTSAWPLRPLPAGLRVAVHDGQLSVDLREAPVRGVLTAIGQQAGLRVHVDASIHRTVTAQFTAMELEQGLRRLLRAASLSYTLRYARSPAAIVVLEEVRVFGEARDMALTSHDRAPIDRSRRTAAPLTPLPQEERVEPAQDAEPEQEAELEPVEPEPDGDATQD
jgi:pyruvate/2-oxoglutarate dehydrogenase complex dihydrolipoamide acyltransferase (E2) component